MGVRIWVERLVGVLFGNGSPNVKIKHFDGIGHECQDVTDVPFPTDGGKPVRIVIERSGDDMPKIEQEVIMQPLLIGQAPSRFTQERDGVDIEPLAFSGWSGQRLSAILGVTVERFHQLVEAINLLDRFPGRQKEKGDKWDVAAAAASAGRIVASLQPGRSVILAGRAVAEAFGSRAGLERLSSLPFCEEIVLSGVTWIIVPHPSGVNRAYNQPATVRAIRDLLRRLLGLAGAEKSVK